LLGNLGIDQAGISKSVVEVGTQRLRGRRQWNRRESQYQGDGRDMAMARIDGDENDARDHRYGQSGRESQRQRIAEELGLMKWGSGDFTLQELRLPKLC